MSARRPVPAYIVWRIILLGAPLFCFVMILLAFG